MSRPVVVQRWEILSFLHWVVDPDLVQNILPAGLTVDTFRGHAYVALVAFRMADVCPPGLRVVPRFMTFPETNVRTYVRGPDGGRGVWFSSLEIPRSLGVVAARLTFGVPYTWADMRIDQTGNEIAYRSRRRWPRPRGARSLVRVRIGEPVETDPLLAFLTNRWRAYTRFAGKIRYASVAHEPWRLRTADVLDLNDDLIAAAGYPGPSSAPLVHYSEGVSARVGRLHSAH